MSANGTELVNQLREARVKLAKAETDLQGAIDACTAAKANLQRVTNPEHSRVWTRGDHWVNVWQPLAAAALFVAGLASLYCDVHHLAALTVLLINAYLALLLVAMAVRQSVRHYWFIDFAHRFFFIFIFFFLLAGLVLSFGRMYEDSKSVYRTADNPPTETLATPTDALYFSTVTIMTVGYGDFAPRRNAEWLVIWQLGSGAMLLLIILPVLASRLALLGEGH